MPVNQNLQDLVKIQAFNKVNPLDPCSSLERDRRCKHAKSLIDTIARRSSDNPQVMALKDIFQKLLDTALPNLSPILPALLTLKGKPYNILDKHFPFEPFFNTFMPQNLVLKTGRQVSKSTSLAAQGVVIANCIPYFNTLYVTPLFEMIRRFSNNYVRGFIEESPVKNLWTSSVTSSNVLQRSFTNKSNMFFSYAFLDADRTRGLNCNKIAFDESVKTATKILLARETEYGIMEDESVEIQNLKIGQIVYGIDEFGQICTDKVKKVSDHGVRACFKIDLSNGDYIECTSESFLATTAGWRRVSTIIEEFYGSTNPDAVGHHAGRWVNCGNKNDQRQSSLQIQPRLQTTPVQHGEVPGFIQVSYESSRKGQERRLRKMVESLDNSQCTGVTPYSCLVFTRGQEARNTDMAGSTDMGRDSLVVHGRRKPTKNKSRLPHRGILKTRSSTPGFLADAQRLAGAATQKQKSIKSRQDLLDNLSNGSCYQDPTSAYTTVYTQEHAVQMQLAEASVYNLPLVQPDVYTQTKSSKVQHHDKTVLRLSSVQEATRLCKREEDEEQPRDTTEDQRALLGTLLCGPRASEGVPSSSCPQLDSQEPGTPQRSQTGSTCGEATIVRISYSGEFQVYDIETELNRTFFANGIAVHNCQDLDATFIPIIRETMSGSPYGDMVQYAGTPKTLDNTLETLWQKSSQGEWIIPCPACHYDNVPAMSHDLDAMIGPWSMDIGPGHPGVICARPSCRRPIDPRDGFWMHARPERLAKFAGYHVPQVIMPMHYEDRDKWQILVGKKEQLFGTPENVFYNEVCGESYDVGSKLVTLSELQEAATLHSNTLEAASACNLDQYHRRVLGVDWGGGGEEETSFTTYAVLGILPSGEIHCIYGYRSDRPHDFNYEARTCLDLIGRFRCSHIAHDYNGAGAYREKYIIDAGFPYERVIPIQYTPPASQDIMRFIDATEGHPRAHYRVDKARSLVLTCAQIKSKRLQFFKDDYGGDENNGLLRDFLALVEDKVTSKSARDIYKIVRQQNCSDDFAQAVNMGCCCLWYMTRNWPNVAVTDRYRISEDVIRAMSPGAGDQVWDDLD